MTKRRILCGAVAMLILAMLACDTSGAQRTTRRSSGDSGHIEISIGKADESTTRRIEIDEDFFASDVELDVTIQVEAGAYHVEFLDESGDVAFTLDPRPGEPATGGGIVTTDMSGEISYRVVAREAQGIKIIIDYQKR